MKKLQERREHLRIDWKKWFRRDNLIVLVLSGILLFIIALPAKERTQGDRGETQKLLEAAESGFADPKDAWAQQSGASEAGDAWEEYALTQEKRLREMLSVMEGVGRVEVMLTLAASEELVVEKDAPKVRSNTNEEDSQGGSRIVAQLDIGDSTVYRTVDGDSEPYVVKTLLPRVEGVLVVAEGAGNGTVNRSITEIAQALFGVEAHKVKVVRMETKER